MQNTQQNNTTSKEEIPMGVVLSGGHTGHKQGPLNPNKNTQKKQRGVREGANRNEHRKKPTDRPANMHTTTHQFCI